MRKYWHVLNIGIQNTLSYRVNFLFRSLFGLIPLTAVLSLWKTIYSQGGTTVAGYTLSQMISYYLVITLVDMLTAVAEDDWQIAADIKDGRISQFLLKPIDYLTYRLSLFAAGRVMYATMAVVPVALFIWFQKEHFVFPASATQAVAFLASVTMTALLQFFISYSLALLAFWLQEVSTFIFIVYALEYLAGGHLFPLDILPHWATSLLLLTPFPFQLYFPAKVYLGGVTGGDLVMGLVMQFIWVCLAWMLARTMWRRGIRHSDAVGG